MSPAPHSSISEQEIDTLEDILFEDELAEDALDYFGVHGLICSTIVGPVSFQSDALADLIFDTHTDIKSDSIEQAKQIIEKLREQISAELSSGSALELPMYDAEEEYYEEALTNWCAGFMEGFLANESTWFETNNDLVAELLLPIMALSQLFDDDDFSELSNNEKIMEQFEEQLPELMTDLFLLFHSENK